MSAGSAGSGRAPALGEGAPAPSPSRRCAFCGAGLEGKRPQARFCRPSCRREHHRIARLVSGRADPPYRNLGEYLRKRANRRAGA